MTMSMTFYLSIMTGLLYDNDTDSLSSIIHTPTVELGGLECEWYLIDYQYHSIELDVV